MTDAQYNVGACLLKGYGVTVDIPEGMRYILMAAEQGDEEAIEMLKSMQ